MHLAALQTSACSLLIHIAASGVRSTGLIRSRTSLVRSPNLNCSRRRFLVSTIATRDNNVSIIMGRWRGNRRQVWKAKDGSRTSTSKGGNGAKDADKNGNVIWSWKQEKEVIVYLTEYRQAAERVYGGGATDDNEKAPVVIGGIIFPALTDIAVSQAYLTLSKALSSKQRKKMHELAVDGTYL
jgi:hypothetical protein